MDISNHASKYKEWELQYNWDTCKTNRQEYGCFIANFLTTDSRVINLNGIYGSGKTEFIRRLYVELAKKGHPVVYIDVWESDFSNNPLAVICSELLQQIEFVFNERAPSGKAKDKKQAVKTFNNLKAKLGTCLKYLEVGSLFTGEPAIIVGTAAASKAVNTTPDLYTKTKPQEYIEVVQKNHIEAVQAIKDIKEYITYLSELIEIIYELNIPIVILIDELDRCRPTYAIEVLEVIKHFFETKGCTFLVATNTEVLEHSVKSVYGQTFDAKLYLRRFFDRKVSLPQASTLDYLATKNLDFDKYKNHNVYLYPFAQNQQTNISLFAALFENNNIELRGVEQILNRFFASLDYATNASTVSGTSINTVVLMVGLIEQHFDDKKLSIRTNKNNVTPGIDVRDNDIFCYSLSEIVDCMFKCVTVTKSKVIYQGSGRATESRVAEEVLTIQSIRYDDINLFKNTQDNRALFQGIINHINDDNCNYWMWDDYKKIIELSGHIQ
jgi:predicted KAP-like P-loop ATPase